MDWSKYSALKSGSKASIAEGVKKEAVKYESGDSGLRSAKAAVKYKKSDDIPEGKKIGDAKTYKKKVGEVKSKVKAVNYSILYMKAVKALQEAMARIETLETKVKALEDA